MVHNRFEPSDLMKIFATVAVLLLTFVYLDVGRADWPCRTDTGVAVSVAAGNQWNVHLASDGGSGAFILWQDRRGGTQDKLYLQHVSSAGNPLWTTDGIPLASTMGFQYYPQMISDGAGGVFIVWQDNRNAVDYDIFAQHISPQGIPLWTANGVPVCTATGNQYNPQLVADGKGGIIVAWQDRRDGDFDIYAQRIDAGGQLVWAQNGLVACNTPGDQVNPVITTDQLNGAIIAWTDYRAGTGFSDIYAQRMLYTGQAMWNADGWQINGVPVCQATNSQWNPEITPDGIGSAYVVWQDRRAGTYDNIFAQLVNSEGTALWAADGIALAPIAGVQYYPQIAADGRGGFVAVWQDNRQGADYDIYGQRVNKTGQLLWNATGQPICVATGHQYNPQVIAQYPYYVTVWQDRRNGTDYDIYSQRLDLNGQIQWALNGVPVTNEPDDQYAPQIATDNQSGAVIAWADYHTSGSSTDIFAHRIGANGKPAGGCYRTFVQDGFNLKSVKTYNKVKRTITMPNEGNIRDSILARGAFAQGLFIGYPRLDAPRVFGWEMFTSRFYIRNALPQNGTARPLDQIYSRSLVGVLRNPSVRRYNNKLSGELMMLKLNIAASDEGLTEPGLGELVFSDTAARPNPMTGRTLRQVAAYVDSTMTYWRSYTAVDYQRLAAWLARINSTFSAPLDTISLTPLKLTAVLPVTSVWFLNPGVIPPPTLPEFQPHIDLIDETPLAFELFQNYPNPFNPVTTIEFSLPEPALVTLKVFNVLGQEVGQLINHQAMDEGRQMVDFNAASLSSGVYFYQIVAERTDGSLLSSQTKKMMLLK